MRCVHLHAGNQTFGLRRICRVGMPLPFRAAAGTGRPAARATKETKANLRHGTDLLGAHVLSAWP